MYFLKRVEGPWTDNTPIKAEYNGYFHKNQWKDEDGIIEVVAVIPGDGTESEIWYENCMNADGERIWDISFIEVYKDGERVGRISGVLDIIKQYGSIVEEAISDDYPRYIQAFASDVLGEKVECDF